MIAMVIGLVALNDNERITLWVTCRLVSACADRTQIGKKRASTNDNDMELVTN